VAADERAPSEHPRHAVTPEPANDRSIGEPKALILLALAVTVVVSFGCLIVLWLVGPKEGSVAFEVAKGCIGIIAVGFVGLVLSRAGDYLQQRRADAAREQAEARDRRQRQDEVVRSLLDASLANYHDVKRARRLLKARLPGAADSGRPDLAVYDEYLAAINNAQLVFEQLEETARTMQDERIDHATLAGWYDDIETYINAVVGEYEQQRRRVAYSDPPPSVSDLKILGDFMVGKHFRAGVTDPLHAAQRVLEKALLQPLNYSVDNRSPSVS
jgi:hypothetical protein